MNRIGRTVAGTALAALLAGCGGGIFVGFGPDDDPPSVSLAASTAGAAPGEIVALSAGAGDDDFVVAVEFFRLDPNGASAYLGTDDAAPYAWNAAMPNFARGSAVQFVARATDSAGQQTDSAAVTVTVD